MDYDQQGKSQKGIPKMIRKNKSTVSRELARNCDKGSGKHHHKLAQRKYRKRMRDLSANKQEKPKHIQITAKIRNFVWRKIKESFSPEQIVDVAKKKGFLMYRTNAFISICGTTKNKEGLFIGICAQKVSAIGKVAFET